MRLLLGFVLVLNLNSATIEQLDELPGIGPVLAGRIVEFREKREGFRRLEELLAIPGISERKWRVLRLLVRVQEPARNRWQAGVQSSRVPIRHH